MGKTKVQVIFESDDLSPMDVLGIVKHRMASLKRIIDITEYEALDWRGRELEESKT